MRDVVGEYGEHPETKSLGRDDQTCTSETVGLLSRRHVRPSWIQHIGKEANRLEDVERGDVQEWDEVLERFEPRGKGEWEVEVLPTPKALGAARVAAASGPQPPSGLSDTSVEAPTSAKEPAHSHQGSACLPGDQVTSTVCYARSKRWSFSGWTGCMRGLGGPHGSRHQGTNFCIRRPVPTSPTYTLPSEATATLCGQTN